MRVGAWCGHHAIRHPERDVDGAHALGLTDLHLMVNDHSKLRRPSRFTTYDVNGIERVAALSLERGIRLHLTSWIMPHEGYLVGAMTELLPLLALCRADSLVWDAEEPWTRATGRMPYADAARFVARLFQGVKTGVTGIGYAPVAKLGPLCQVSTYTIVQAYATSTSGVKPHRTGSLVKRWQSRFNRPTQAGLAAYRTTPDDMRGSLLSVRQQGVEEVVYWSLGWLLRNPRLRAVVKSVTEGGTCPT